MRLNMVRQVLLLAIGCLLVAACGPEPLGRVGDRASSWIGAPAPPSVVTAPPTTLPVLVPSTDIAWYNDGLEPVEGESPADIIAAVYRRGASTDRFVQASRLEVAAALPGVGFPADVPAEVRFITSQLVYENGRGLLAEDYSAAFGLWSAEPYSRSRTAGQSGVLMVSQDGDESAAVAAGAGDLTCARFADETRTCLEIFLGATPAWTLANALGSTLVWYQAPYRYELFLRSDIAAMLSEMATRLVPLSELNGRQAVNG
jgi:hypothetical protein